MNKKILIIGTGSQARVVMEILRGCGRTAAGFVIPDNSQGSADSPQKPEISPGLTIQGLPVYDWDSCCSIQNDFEFIPGIGDNHFRRIVCEKGESAGLNFTSAIHPSAVCGSGTVIGPGTVVAANAVCVLDVKIGKGVIINTGASVDHDCIIGNWCHVAPGGVLAGRVKLEDEVFVGAGGVIIQGIRIGERTVLGAGAVAVKDIPPGIVAVGVPAGKA